MGQWRSRVVVLRSALSDAADSNDCSAAGLGVRQSRRLSADLQFQRQALHIPSNAANLTLWHRFFERHCGCPPPSCLVLLLNEPESNALMHVVCTKLLRGQRGTDYTATSTSRQAADDDDVDSDANGSDNEDEGRTSAQKDPSDEQPVVRINDFPSKFNSNLSLEQQETLRFFRHLMPLQLVHEEGTHRTSPSVSLCGLGVWLYAGAVAVDLPVDPDLDRLFNDLFRACCRHITVLSEHFKGVNAPLLVRVEQGRERAGTTSPSSKQYWEMNDIGEKEVTALYTLLVILAKILRQNQANAVPI